MTPPTAPGIRARNRAAIETEIRRVARRHLAESGAAALSLRAVARDLDMVPSALYRYVASRDDLLTLLIVDAYDDLGDAVDAALGPLEDAAPRSRFVAIAETLRTWALEHPADYALLFGSPVPDYRAPADRTNASGTRVYARLLTLAAGLRTVPDLAGLDEATQLEGAAALDTLVRDPQVALTGVTPLVLQRALAAWHLVHGAVTSEVFEQLGPDVATDPVALFAATADLATAVLFGDAD
ncbi:conserved hypothetical protein [Nostocoides japonicum T1-X7]|uniref:HTH tetR-type domain-containing protein n=1 Tax=Nostocoides japonicum T1-X7 TaxID=1194083 RepID=A0A077M520_9MICO|nr:TetR/AcrR family transcriptional regulator [Tetrasphaera japonica]CCH80157.1 conserved hypothetical protein [Tetrasphaera japonica T1-X7]